MSQPSTNPTHPPADPANRLGRMLTSLETVAVRGLTYGPDLPAGSYVILLSGLAYGLVILGARLLARRLGMA